ncbi:(2Fe-2S)-binding protein [Maricurvus nonylphenolicus]|uniref:(2Fe-2S)-binding protein n=1 Tax=Maricurvus nonylphenolicus TaxID=1008307 RepID=UPI0036F3F6DF
MISFKLNGKSVSTEAAADTPLLWVIREQFGLKGSKFGCGLGLCGACSMQLNGESIRTCVMPVSAVEGQSITTIEGLGTEENLHILQQAWIAHNVPQCGYCQSGQLMSASALLMKNKAPSEADIDNAMSGNICRCGTYPRIKAAILDAANRVNQGVNFYTPEELTQGVYK